MIVRAVALVLGTFVGLVSLWACVPTAPPPLQLTLTAPTPQSGSFVTSPTVTVAGSINNAPSAHRVEVNGVEVAIDPLDRTFSTEVALDFDAVINPISVTAVHIGTGETDSTVVTVAAGPSVADGDFSPESVALRINDSGLDQLEPVVGNLVDLDLATLVPVGQVLIDNECFVDGGFLGCLGRATVRVSNPPPALDSFGIVFDSTTNSVDADVNLAGLEINVDIDGSGTVPNCGLRITATGTDITGNYALEPSATGSVDVVQTNTAGVTFTGFNDEFTSGLCDAPIIGGIIEALLPNIESVTGDGIAAFLNATDADGNTPIAAAIETALAGIDISGPIGSSLGSDLDAPLFVISEDNDGLTLGSDSRFVADCTPPAGAPDFAESFAPTEAFPTFGPTTPGTGTPFGVGICISTAGLNQLLKAQTECGLLLTSITELDLGGGPIPLNAGTLSAFIPQFSTIPAATAMRIDIVPTMAPLFTGQAGPAGELAELRIGHLLARIVRTDTEELLLEGAVSAQVGTDLSVDVANNLLNFVLAPPPPTAVTVGITDNTIGADPAQLSAILPPLVSLLLPDLASSLAAFPVPSFLDLNLNVLEIEKNGEFLSIFADLSQ